MKKKVAMVVMAGMFALTGCTSIIEMTAEEEELVAEYAADSVIDYYHDVKTQQQNKYKVHPQQTEATKPAKTEASTEAKVTEATKNDTTAGEGETTVDASNNETTQVAVNPAGDGSIPEYTAEELGRVLKVDGVELEMIGYSVVEHYPNDPYALAVDATKGYKLLVVEYDVWNSANNDAVMKVDGSQAIIKAVVNGTDQLSLYKTMLKQDLMNMNETEFKAGEAKTGVLIFRVAESVAENISSVNVSAKSK